jgi:AcrR family transcriptional regulator
VTAPVLGRRERKKAATRKALADAALALFLERGFDQVTVAEIAEAADVSVTTLFKHFPSKEALVFDEDSAQEAELVAAVRDRDPGAPLLDALQAFLVARFADADSVLRDPDLARFRELASSTPSVREYGRRMWVRHEDALARAIAEDLGLDGPTAAVRVLAHVVTDVPALLHDPGVDAREQIDALFALVRDGWPL